MRLRNIAVTPIVLLVRLPLFALGTGLIWLGSRMQDLGRLVPGLKDPL